jgi:serine/threonine protein kinase
MVIDRHSKFIAIFFKAIDFVDKLLKYDHEERPTAKEAMVRSPIFCHVNIFIIEIGPVISGTLTFGLRLLI